MEMATPRALAALLKREKEDVMSAWEARVKQTAGAHTTSSAWLRDDLPPLLDELAAALENTATAGARVQAFSAAHGKQRQEVGMHLTQVVEEYEILRSSIIGCVEKHGMAVVGDANRIVNELVDEGIKSAIQAYIEQRDQAERRRRDEYLKFLVHDLRSPLAAIYYAILLIERDLGQSNVGERARAMHAAIKRNVEQMRALIAKLLQEERNLRTSHVEVRRALIEVWPIVQSAAHLLEPIAAKVQVQIVNEVPTDLVADADGELLERIIQNLMSNAIEHARGSRIAVGATVTPAGDFECWVTDNGRGMPEELRRRVFERFVTGEPQGAGVGLGLAVVKQLVQAHGGTIDLHSESGKGTTVRFVIPQAQRRR